MEDVMFRSDLIKAAFLDELAAIFEFKAGMTKMAALPTGAVGEALENILRMEGRAAPEVAEAAGLAARPVSAEAGALSQRLRRLRGAQTLDAAVTGPRAAMAPAGAPVEFAGMPAEALPVGEVPGLARAGAGGADALIARPAGAAAGAAEQAAAGGIRGTLSGMGQRIRPWLAPLAAGGIGYALTGNPLIGLLAGGGMAAAGRLGRGVARLTGRGGGGALEMAEKNVGQMAPEAIEGAGGRMSALNREYQQIMETAKTNPELAQRLLAANAPRYGLGMGVALPAALGAGYFGLKGTKNLIMGDQESGLGTIPSLALGAGAAYGTHKLLENTNIPWLQNPLAQYGLPALAGLMAPQFAGSMIG